MRICLRGAQVWQGDGFQQEDLYISDGRMVDSCPTDAVTIDVDGYYALPGLVNAHDHLELNHFPRTKFRQQYANAHHWGTDVDARLNDEPYHTLRHHHLRDKLFVGGLKNLLSGVTTVAHHGDSHPSLFTRDFPVRVLQRYGWAHSLHFDDAAAIVRSYQQTPKHHAWFIHLAEGTDDTAASEYRRLRELGCVGAKTVIVHGVGMTATDTADALERVRGLVWCPSTNAYLLGVRDHPHAEQWHAAGKLALGSDSRLTADADLLDELPYTDSLTAPLSLVTDAAAQLIGVSAGTLSPGAAADVILTPTLRPARADLALILRDGMPVIGNANFMAQFSSQTTIPCTVDDTPKEMILSLAKSVHRCTLADTGVEVAAIPLWRRFWVF